MVSITQAISARKDVKLARRVAAGDRRAVEEFVDLYSGRVQALARRYADGTDAEDLTQEIFVDLFRSAGSFTGKSQFSTWVYRVAINHCLRHRERARPPMLPYDDALRFTASLVGNPAQCAARGELSDKVYDALDTLTAEHRAVVILHEMHGLTYTECAEALGVPVGTVKSRLSNAFRRLRERLSGYVTGEDRVLARAETLP